MNHLRSLFPPPAVFWLAIVLIPAGGCAGGHAARPVEPQAALAVEAPPLEASLWREGLRVSATVRPVRRATPGTVLMGNVDRVLRQVGDRVRRGDVLARVESREVSARLAQAQAAVAAARAVERNAALMRDRMQRLFDRQAASRRNLDDAEAGHQAALANLRAAEEGVKAAEMYVAYASVRAPFDGVVVERRVEVGDTATPGRPLFVIEDLSRVRVEADVPESRIGAIVIGETAEVELAFAGAGGTRRGTVTEILPAGDPRSRTFTVRVELDNPRGDLRSGMFARLTLGSAETSVLAVGREAVVRRGPLTGVFVVEEAAARLRYVTLGDERQGRFRVLTGLRAGDRVVALPQRELRDGRPVEVLQ